MAKRRPSGDVIPDDGIDTNEEIEAPEPVPMSAPVAPLGTVEAPTSTDVARPARASVPIEQLDGRLTETPIDDGSTVGERTVFIQGVRHEHCATLTDGRWVYRKG
jgi:hypothetical protein